jgi:hypothetical protein
MSVYQFTVPFIIIFSFMDLFKLTGGFALFRQWTVGICNTLPYVAGMNVPDFFRCIQYKTLLSVAVGDIQIEHFACLKTSCREYFFTEQDLERRGEEFSYVL